MPKLVRSSLLVLALACAGCATFESGELPGLARWPEVAGASDGPHARPRVAVVLHGLPDKFADGWQRGVAGVLSDSGRWQSVDAATVADASQVDAPGGADRQLVFAFAHSRQDLWLTRIWMGVCGMTAGIVPARTVQYFELEATVRDADGRELGKVTRSVDGQTWVGWLPLLALPFAGGGLGELVRDTTRSVVVEAVDNGWL